MVLVVVAAMFQQPVLSALLRKGLEIAFSKQGLVLRAESVQVGIASPLLIQGLSIHANESGGGRAILATERLEIRWSGFGALLSNPRKLIREVSFDRPDFVLDLRRPESAVLTPEPALDAAATLLRFLALGGAWPDSIAVRDATIEVLADGSRWVMDGLEVSLNSQKQGRFELQSLIVQSGHLTKIFGPLSAPTVWQEGSASLAGLEVVPGITVSELSLHLANGAEPSLSFMARVFGGALRGDVNLRHGERGRIWDVAAIASNITVDALPALLDLPGRATGTLAEGRLTFRGESGRPTDAEASLRVLAKDFRWNDRGWESLEIGASLIHRRLLVSNFDLRQKDNKVTLNGEISLAEGWAKIAESPFLMNIRANIKELGSLAGLLGGPLGEASGQLTAEGSVSGRPGSLDGFVGIRGTGLSYRSVPVDQMRLELLFRKKKIELVTCEMRAGQDALDAKGEVDLAAPHQYSAELTASLTELATYLALFREKGLGGVSGGALAIRWKGAGAAGAHSGAFDLELSRFVSSLTPAGLTGQFVGTYSPKNIYFSKLEMENAKMRLRTRATFSLLGVNLEDVELTAGSKPLLAGSGFLPVNLFSIREGGDWKSAVVGDRNMYVQTSTPAEIDLQDLVRLAGQEFPLRGFLKMQLEAYGPFANLDGTALLQARGVVFGGTDIPASSFEIKLNAKAGEAELEGEMKTERMAPVTVKAAFPFGFYEESGGQLLWMNRQAPFEAVVDFPRASMVLLRPLAPSLRGLTGEFSGSVKITGTMESPQLAGEIAVSDAGFRFGALASRVDRTNGRILIGEGAVRFVNIEGEVTPGRFEIQGVCDFPKPWTPRWNLAWRGERLPIRLDAGASLFASVGIEAKDGVLSGRVEFEDPEIRQRIALRPLLATRSVDPMPLASYAKTLSLLAPGGDWRMDVGIVAREPISIDGPKFQGAMVPALRLIGMAANPVPVGRITLRGVDAGGFFIDEGTLDFLPDQPWKPFATIGATGWFGNHRVRAVAFGPLHEQKWILSSDTLVDATPQDLFLLVDRGLEKIRFDGLESVDKHLYASEVPGRVVVISSRIEPGSLWRGGVGFLESLDGSPRGALLPMESFRGGFEWNWSPLL